MYLGMGDSMASIIWTLSSKDILREDVFNDELRFFSVEGFGDTGGRLVSTRGGLKKEEKGDLLQEIIGGGGGRRSRESRLVKESDV